jgi:hypothetical protein
MKKLFAISVLLVLALALVACGSGASEEVAVAEEQPLIPVPCGEETLYVKLENVEAYREACAIQIAETAEETEVVCEPEVEKPDVAEPVEAEEPVVNEPVVIVSAPKACGYDYSVMPRGEDEHGNPLADEGISYIGEIEGPAIVQIDSLTAVTIFPGETFYVPEGDIVTWKYIGDDACLRAQYQWFPGKTFYAINEIEITN